MFENIIEEKLGGPKKLNKLLSKYIELHTLQDFYHRTQDHHKLKHNKRKLLKLIHHELKKRMKPEETFEVWHQLKNLNVNLDKLAVPIDVDTLFRSLNDKDSQPTNTKTRHHDDQNDDQDDEDDSLVIEKLKKFTQSFDTSSSTTKSSFFILSNGLEILPSNTTKPSFQRQHIQNLTTLLHINIVRKNWNLAYKIFCLLVRFPLVDIRSIWSLGVEILKHQQTPSNSLVKDDKFFEWLSSFYVINHLNSATRLGRSRLTGAPIWRTGSRTLSSLYVVTSLWNMLFKHDYAALRNRLEELLLEPPYDSDGIIYFLLALCKLGEATELANQADGNNDYGSTYTKLTTLMKSVDSDLNKVDSLDFVYPKEYVNQQMVKIMKFVDGDFEDVSDDSSSSENDPDPTRVISQVVSQSVLPELDIHDEVEDNQFDEFEDQDDQDDHDNEIFHDAQDYDGQYQDQDEDHDAKDPRQGDSMDFDFDFD
jgi:RNA polymerase I-specific transcription initiation factor RRN11